VENAILHGLRGRPDGVLTIDVRRTADKIIYTIEDNGTGRSTMNGNPASKGIGMQLSSDRVRLFNQEERANVEVIDLVSNAQPAGTRVIVQLNAQE
jgi:LytS/YehU family sensor histidine kinase